MHQTAYAQLSVRFRQLDPADGQYATRFVELLLETAQTLGASDIHLQPMPDGLELRLRLDGVLQSVGMFPAGMAANIVARLKVLADLLTYRTDVPQEGRIRAAGAVEMRVSSFLTLYGEKAVVRLFAVGRFLDLEDLGLPGELTVRLRQLLAETSGAILITGRQGVARRQPPMPVCASWSPRPARAAASPHWKTRSKLRSPASPNRK